MYFIIHTLWLTLDESISFHSARATAHRDVIIHITDCIGCTYAWTWIRTLAVEACLIAWTIGVQDALGATARIGISVIFGQTSASTVTALCVCSAWRWIARIFVDRFGS